jgi:hypothetical protein
VSQDRDPLDRLQETAERVIDRTNYEQGNRRSLLWVHAIVGMFAGLQMLLWGSAYTIETAIGVWVRLVLAALGMSGGLVLAIGLSRRPRSVILEAVGLVAIGLWDLIIAAGLMIARVKQHNFDLIPPTHPLELGYIVAYPTTVYLGLFALILIHLSTLRRIRRRGLGQDQ